MEGLCAKALVALLAGCLAVDRVAFLQSLLSRPLPAAALAGLLLGRPETGLWCGMFLELIWIVRHPVGGAIPPDETLAALAGVCAACGAPEAWTPQSQAALGVLLGLPFGALGARLDERVRRANGAVLGLWRSRWVSGESTLAAAQRAGALRFFAAGALGGAMAAFVLGPLASALAAAWPEGLKRGMDVFSALLPVIGVGSLLSGLPGWGARAAFGLGLLGGLGLGRGR